MRQPSDAKLNVLYRHRRLRIRLRSPDHILYSRISGPFQSQVCRCRMIPDLPTRTLNGSYFGGLAMYLHPEIGQMCFGHQIGHSGTTDI